MPTPASTIIQIENLVLGDINANDIPAFISDGEIKVQDVFYGDVSGDGKVTAGDATLF